MIGSNGNAYVIRGISVAGNPVGMQARWPASLLSRGQLTKQASSISRLEYMYIRLKVTQQPCHGYGIRC